MKNRGLKKTKFDRGLLVTTILLLSLGIIMVTSASWPVGVKVYEDGFHYTKLQVVYTILGIVAMAITYRLPISFYKRLSYLVFGISFLLFCLLFTPLGIDHYGSVRWLRIPVISKEFMPSDLVKFASIFCMAKYLCDNAKRLKYFNTFSGVLIIIGMSVGPIFLKDFSTSIVILVSIIAVFFVMGISVYQYVVLFLGAMTAVYLMLTKFAYRMERLTAFLDPFDDLSDTDLQLAHSLYAFGIGGFSGVGAFQSRQKYSYIPEAHNDFIFAILGEEFGFIGGFIIIVLFIFFVIRGYYIAIHAKTLYEKLVATGITTSIGIQAFFNIGVTMGMLPVTGITLPFISYGGTSVIITLAAVGVLLGISKRGRVN